MTRIIVVRHGQSEANLQKLFAAHTDAKLTDLGRKQAEAVAEVIAATEKIDVVYASDLSRATDTVAPAAARFGLSVIPDKELREIRAGEWENLPFEVLRTNPDFVADYDRWANDMPHCRCTGGESVVEMYHRVVSEVLRIAARHDGETVLIGTHWTPAMALIVHALVGSADGMAQHYNPINAALQIFRYEDGRLILEAQNLADHLKNIANEPYKP